MRKREIVSDLMKDKDRIDKIIEALGRIGEDDQTTKRYAQNDIVLTLMELVENISKVEVSIYNYLRRKGWK